MDEIGGERIRHGAKVASVALSERQQAEIFKAFARAPKPPIFDEATSALNSSVAATVFGLVHVHRDRGVGVLFISHHFRETEASADRKSAFRNGQSVATFMNGEHHDGSVADMMVGQRIEDNFPQNPMASQTAPVASPRQFGQAACSKWRHFMPSFTDVAIPKISGIGSGVAI